MITLSFIIVLLIGVSSQISVEVETDDGTTYTLNAENKETSTLFSLSATIPSSVLDGSTSAWISLGINDKNKMVMFNLIYII